MSNTGLATAVVAAGASEGIHLGTSTTSVRRMLDGAQPHWPAPKLGAAVLSGRLQREVSVTECGFVDRTPAGEDPYDGLRCSGTLDGAIRTIVELSGRDMRAQAAAGLGVQRGRLRRARAVRAHPPPAQGTARAGGQRIGMLDVEVLSEQVANLHKLSAQYWAGRVRGQLVALLHGEANRLLHGSYTEKTGKALLSAVARGVHQASGMTGDVGRHALAQRYSIQALDLAMRGVTGIWPPTSLRRQVA